MVSALDFRSRGRWFEPGFLKVPKRFRARKAIKKILNLMFTKLFFSHNFNSNKVNFHAKFNANTLLSFWDTDHWKWLKLSGLSRSRPQVCAGLCHVAETRLSWAPAWWVTWLVSFLLFVVTGWQWRLPSCSTSVCLLERRLGKKTRKLLAMKLGCRLAVVVEKLSKDLSKCWMPLFELWVR